VVRLTVDRAGGVTRMSFGVQSTARHVLVALGRRHDPDLVPRAVELANAAGFERVNVDLIYGAVGESDEDWARTLGDVLSLAHPPGHVSAYALTVEPGTPLGADPARHPDEDIQAKRYELAEDMLSAAGYEWEEVSNWARPGHGCRHNMLYWHQGDYRGIGSAAHSHSSSATGGRRWWNVRTPDRYVTAIEAGTLRPSLRDDLASAASGRHVPVLGITGTGGSGKSSLTDELLRRFRLDHGDARPKAEGAPPPPQPPGGGRRHGGP
jgi:oxygen-independent coproporphyrinogen-3 oxidase